jgi:NAD(P)H dehydrogenase (quinone)
MILVSGAGGKTGAAVVRALARGGIEVRAFVRRPGQVEASRAAGSKEEAVGDMLDPQAWVSAAYGMDAIYLICPNVSPDEKVIAGLAINAARDRGVRRLVYHSVLHPQAEEMPHHWRKLRVEEELFKAGVPFTILQPAPYMQNALAARQSIVGHSLFPVPYGLDTRLSMVDLEDVAEVAARVLIEPGHDGAIYELAGPEPLSQTELAGALAEVVGRPVDAVRVPLTEWEGNARNAGMGSYEKTALLEMFRYYDKFGLSGNPNVLTWLLGRPPTTFARFAAREFR